MFNHCGFPRSGRGRKNNELVQNGIFEISGIQRSFFQTIILSFRENKAI
jgi:hypothetical protein